MTAWTTIANALVAVGAKPFASTMQALRDNPIAIAEKDPTVPNALRTGLWPLGSISTASGSSLSLTSLDLSYYTWIEAHLQEVTHNNGTSANLTLNGTFFDGAIASDLVSGFLSVRLDNGFMVGYGGSLNAAPAFSSIRNTTTTLTVAVSAGAFDGGIVRFFGEALMPRFEIIKNAQTGETIERQYTPAEEAAADAAQAALEAARRAGLQLTFAQLISGLVSEGWITKAEGRGWLRGTLPAPVVALIGDLPEAEQIFAEAKAVRPSVILRNDPLVLALATMQGKTPEQLDAFFNTYGEA